MRQAPHGRLPCAHIIKDKQNTTERQIQAWSSLVLDWCRSSLYASKLPHERTRDRCDSQVTLILKSRTGLTRSSYSYKISVMEIPKRIRYPIKKTKVSEPATALQNEEREAEVTIQDDQLGLEPEEEYEEPPVRSQNTSYENKPWEPCETCKLEVQALLKENKMMKDVLSSMTYVMSCGKWHGWKPVEKSKLKKALINKLSHELN
ncbi:hypothetical protein QQF64_036408 [Cirrhinus molitorella]|uniref:Uncharacterized protein n=1 Tax=Cirrhinus molitorella TaxID=172907 RepID=A0ABR3NIL5_9TELE